jgi:hypothetical protein
MFIVLLWGSSLKESSWRPGMGWNDNIDINRKKVGF